MVFVILRNGKVLQYNEGQQICIEDGTITVRTDKKTNPPHALVARVPLEVVERAEFDRPCKILKAKKAPKRARY
jgi:hypothetical protein